MPPPRSAPPPPGSGRFLGTAGAFLAGLLLAAGAFPQAAPETRAEALEEQGTVLLPPMVVVGQTLKEFPLFKKAEVTPPGFSDRSAPLDLFYPPLAYHKDLYDGDATVGVMLDAEGKTTDYLLLRYTDRVFGDSLMEEAREQLFAPRRVKGMAVPGRFEFGYHFSPNFTVWMSSFDAIQERAHEIEGGPRWVYEPHMEYEIDGGKLTFTAATVPFIPDGVVAPQGKPLEALVTFFVDEEGHVRLPSVESAATPLLIANAVKAVSHWRFRPPTIAGKPVLVYTGRSVAFVQFVPRPAPPRPAQAPAGSGR